MIGTGCRSCGRDNRDGAAGCADGHYGYERSRGGGSNGGGDTVETHAILTRCTAKSHAVDGDDISGRTVVGGKSGNADGRGTGVLNRYDIAASVISVIRVLSIGIDFAGNAAEFVIEITDIAGVGRRRRC